MKFEALPKQEVELISPHNMHQGDIGVIISDSIDNGTIVIRGYKCIVGIGHVKNKRVCGTTWTLECLSPLFKIKPINLKLVEV